MKISSILLFVCIAFLSSISAENEFGTRSISLGGAYTALSDDWEGLGNNPAGLVDIDKYTMGLTFRRLLFKTDEDALYSGAMGFILPWKRCEEPSFLTLTFGLGATYFRSELTNKVGLIPALSLGFGGSRNKTVKLGIKSRIEKLNYDESFAEARNDPLLKSDPGFKYAVDAGLIFEWGVFRIGMLAENINEPNYSSEGLKSGEISRLYKAGLSLDFSSFRFAVDESYKSRFGRWRTNAGFETNLSQHLSLRVGINGKEYFTAGLGVSVERFQIGYSALFPNQYAPQRLTTHYLSLAYGVPRSDKPDFIPKPDTLIVYMSCGKLDSFSAPKGIVRVKNCSYYGGVKVAIASKNWSPTGKPSYPEAAVFSLEDYDKSKGGYTFTLPKAMVNSILQHPGKEEIALFVDIDNEVDESNENNNIKVFPVRVVESCGNIALTAKAIPNCGKDYFRVGAPIKFELTIRFDSAGVPPGYIKVGFYTSEPTSRDALPVAMDSISLANLELEPEKGRVQEQVSFSKIVELPKTAPKEIYIKIDPENKIPETNETDNTVRLEIPFAPALSATVKTVSPVLLPISYVEEPIIPVVYFDERSKELIFDGKHNSEILDTIRARLKANPDLTVELRGYYDPFMDSEIFNLNEFNARSSGTPKKEKLYKTHVDSLTRFYIKRNGKVLQRLALERAQVVRNYIVQKDPDLSARVKIGKDYSMWVGVNNYLEPDPKSWFENRRVEIRTNESSLYNPIVHKLTSGKGSPGRITFNISGGIGEPIISAAILNGSKTIREISNNGTVLNWDGLDKESQAVEPGVYEVEGTITDGCSIVPFKTSIAVTYQMEVRILRLYQFNMEKAEFYSPPLEHTKQVVKKSVEETKRTGSKIIIEGYACYLKLFGSATNCQLSLKRAKEIAKLLNLTDIEVRGCGDNINCGEVPQSDGCNCGISCSGSWHEMMKNQVDTPASRARSRASILVIENKQ